MIRFQERKVNVNELAEFMQKLIKTWNDITGETQGVSKVESRTSICEPHSNASCTTAVIVNFVTAPTGKLAANARKRLENQVSSLTLTAKKV